MSLSHPTVLAGIPPATLQQWLASAQLALFQLQSGQQVASASYAQGDGAKSVSYRQADMASLNMLIRQIQQELGIIRR
ncbi:MAG TPA: gpW family head-tail joining protein, partial [Novosphingobium sp.]|nr:gpW family head-tail joining protein [Novosphingobium sp.]